MTDRLSDIRARLAAATPGPWEVSEYEARRPADVRVWCGGSDGYLIVCEHAGPDAEFIANAPADIAWLLGRIQELTAQRDAARAKLAEAWGEGVDAALERRTQLVNPYLLPGEDGPR